jgi:hypothetical protein
MLTAMAIAMMKEIVVAVAPKPNPPSFFAWESKSPKDAPSGLVSMYANQKAMFSLIVPKR